MFLFVYIWGNLYIKYNKRFVTFIKTIRYKTYKTTLKLNQMEAMPMKKYTKQQRLSIYKKVYKHRLKLHPFEKVCTGLCFSFSRVCNIFIYTEKSLSLFPELSRIKKLSGAYWFKSESERMSKLKAIIKRMSAKPKKK